MTEKKKLQKQGSGTLMAEMSTEHNFGDEIDATLLGEDFTISNITFHVNLPKYLLGMQQYHFFQIRSDPENSEYRPIPKPHVNFTPPKM